MRFEPCHRSASHTGFVVAVNCYHGIQKDNQDVLWLSCTGEVSCVLWASNYFKTSRNISLYQSSTPFFSDIQLCTAMHTHSVPWNLFQLSVLWLFNIIAQGCYKTKCENSGRVWIFSKSMHLSKSIDRLWRAILSSSNSNPNWKLICQSRQQSFWNPKHQDIKFNLIHRTYFIPWTLHKMKALSLPNCTLCTQNALSTVFQMVWNWPRVLALWERVSEMLSSILSETSLTFLM